MEATELRKKTGELEKQVKILVEQFIEDVGTCDIDIRTDLEFIQNLWCEKELINTYVKVNVTV